MQVSSPTTKGSAVCVLGTKALACCCWLGPSICGSEVDDGGCLAEALCFKGDKWVCFMLFLLFIVPFFLGSRQTGFVDPKWKAPSGTDFQFVMVTQGRKYGVPAEKFEKSQKSILASLSKLGKESRYSLTYSKTEQKVHYTNSKGVGFEIIPATNARYPPDEFVNHVLVYYLTVVNRVGNEKYLFEVQLDDSENEQYMLTQTSGLEKAFTQNKLFISNGSTAFNSRNMVLGIFQYGDQTFAGTYGSIKQLLDKKTSAQRVKTPIVGPVLQFITSFKGKGGIELQPWIPKIYQRSNQDVWMDGLGFAPIDSTEYESDPDKKKPEQNDDDDKPKVNVPKPETFGTWFRALDTWKQVALAAGVCLILILLLCCSYYACCAPAEQPQPQMTPQMGAPMPMGYHSGYRRSGRSGRGYSRSGRSRY